MKASLVQSWWKLPIAGLLLASREKVNFVEKRVCGNDLRFTIHFHDMPWPDCPQRTPWASLTL
jgi:hypothetical protein